MLQGNFQEISGVFVAMLSELLIFNWNKGLLLSFPVFHVRICFSLSFHSTAWQNAKQGTCGLNDQIIVLDTVIVYKSIISHNEAKRYSLICVSFIIHHKLLFKGMVVYDLFAFFSSKESLYKQLSNLSKLWRNLCV